MRSRNHRVDAYRMSLSWTRVFPDGTRRNPAGLDFDDRLIDATLARNIEPFVTINHREVPLALAERGGCPNRFTYTTTGTFNGRVVGNVGLSSPQPATVPSVAGSPGSSARSLAAPVISPAVRC
ncbi:family 1 glycosylhydrolase [Cryobacterium sp. TMB1-7]|uniref:family 1 glycosylhydrolase n=1 Tax=Cryobacterium sp. TMB1-7 TaxID=2555866 RepID=UPI003519F7AE